MAPSGFVRASNTSMRSHVSRPPRGLPSMISGSTSSRVSRSLAMVALRETLVCSQFGKSDTSGRWSMTPASDTVYRVAARSALVPPCREPVLVWRTPGGADLHGHVTGCGVDDQPVGVLTERIGAVAAVSVVHDIGDEPPGTDHLLGDSAGVGRGRVSHQGSLRRHRVPFP